MIDGTRKVTGISEVAGVENEQVVMHDIFNFERTGVNQRGQVMGKFVATGYKPTSLGRLKAYGIHIAQSIFHEEYVIKEK